MILIISLFRLRKASDIITAVVLFSMKRSEAASRDSIPPHAVAASYIKTSTYSICCSELLDACSM